MTERRVGRRTVTGLKQARVAVEDPVVQAELSYAEGLDALRLPPVRKNRKGEKIEVRTGHVLPCPLSE